MPRVRCESPRSERGHPVRWQRKCRTGARELPLRLRRGPVRRDGESLAGERAGMVPWQKPKRGPHKSAVRQHDEPSQNYALSSPSCEGSGSVTGAFHAALLWRTFASGNLSYGSGFLDGDGELADAERWTASDVTSPAHVHQTYCFGTKIRTEAGCDPWRRTARKNRSRSGEKKLVRAPFTVGIRSESA
jgi:hypothetical protein